MSRSKASRYFDIPARSYFSGRRARVRVLRMPHQAPMRQHGHEFLEIAVVFSGSGIHVTGAQRHTLQAGDVLVISRRRTHGYERTSGLNLVNILIRGSLLARLARDLGALAGFRALFPAADPHWDRRPYLSRLRLSAAELDQVGEWIDKMEEETHLGTQGGDLLAEAYLSLIVGVLSRRYGRQAVARTPAAAPFGKLLSWLERNLDRPLTVAEMAAQSAMSERSFYRGFRQAMGASPFDYLLKARIRRAGELLRDRHGKHSVTEIAGLCGFEDSNHFSRSFRTAMGASPTEYRARFGG